MRRPTVACLALSLALASTPARAGDPFEIQVYDGTANPPGTPGIELHLNDWATGNRDFTPEAPLHGQFHATLEPSFGLTPFWELGAYMQFAVRTDDGIADWAGAKLRSKFVTPPGWDPHWRLGVNLEVSYLPATYDASRWGGEIRPIAAWQNKDWLFAVNPIVDLSFAEPGASDGPVFAPAAKLARAVGPVALGFEYYATIGPFASIPSWSRQQHQIFEVVDLLSVERFELNFGVGEGLTSASEGVVVKAIMGYTFETATTRSPLRAHNLGWSRRW